MNNREIIDYILSGNLEEGDMIKKVEKDPFYEDGEKVSYLTNDGYYLIDTETGVVSVLSFMDSKSNYKRTTLAGHSTDCTVTYEIVDREQVQQEINNKKKEKEILELKRRLVELSAAESVDDVEINVKFTTASAAKKEDTIINAEVEESPSVEVEEEFVEAEDTASKEIVDYILDNKEEAPVEEEAPAFSGFVSRETEETTTEEVEGEII